MTWWVYGAHRSFYEQRNRRLDTVARLTMRQLDDAFPTVVRYAGVVLAFVLVAAGIAGQGGSTIASGGVLALGMILYKSVKGAANDEK